MGPDIPRASSGLRGGKGEGNRGGNGRLWEGADREWRHSNDGYATTATDSHDAWMVLGRPEGAVWPRIPRRGGRAWKGERQGDTVMRGTWLQKISVENRGSNARGNNGHATDRWSVPGRGRE